MLSASGRDRRVSATEKRISALNEKIAKYETRLTTSRAEMASETQTLTWLRSMPVEGSDGTPDVPAEAQVQPLPPQAAPVVESGDIRSRVWTAQ